MIRMISLLASIQQTQEYLSECANACRKYCIPFVLGGGRDMILLKNGWIDIPSVIAPEYVLWKYDSDKHHVIHRDGGAVKRWKWLSAVGSPGDMSDFFSNLRVSTGVELSDADAIALYAHQKGMMPCGKMYYTLRNGLDGVVDVDALFI